LHVVRRPPHRRRGRLGARSALGLLLAAAIALAGGGVSVARAETPAQKVARLRSQAAEVQAAIDRMNDQVETVVEQFNANREALQATLDRQRDTTRRLDEAQKRLATAESLMGDRMRAIYMGGPVTGLEELLEVRSVEDAVTVTQYQESANASDVQTIAAVQQGKQELSAIDTTLKAQRHEQERLQAKLDDQRHDIEARLAQQQEFLGQLSAGVKRAVAEEQQRQEDLRRAALARRLAAEQAAREAAEKAAREQAAREAAARAAASDSSSSSSTGGGSGSSDGDSGGSSSTGGGGSGGSASSSSSSSGSTSSGSSGGSTSTSGAGSTHWSPPSSSGGSSSAPSSAAARAVAYARAQLGKPYVWGAEGPNSFDCSGLTMTAWRSAGVSIPRVAQEQYNIGGHVSQSELEPGDLVFFGSPIHHVGLYVGNGTMIEAPYTGQVVRYHSINRSDYAGATRPTG
jgi:peptidoglycan DL-endopeptidase CwlO